MNRSALFHKVLSGNASKSQLDEFEKFIAQSNSNLTEFNDVKLFYSTPEVTSINYTEQSLTEAFEKINRLIKNKQANQKKNQLISITIVALSFLVAVTIAFLFLGNHESNQILKFDNAPMTQVISSLEREYDIQVSITDNKSLACTFTGTFHGAQAHQVIQSIASSLNVEFTEMSKGKFSLTGGRCR